MTIALAWEPAAQRGPEDGDLGLHAGSLRQPGSR
jgi:hypothetical protein